RADLPRGAAIASPAVLIEAISTTVIEPGWHGEVGAEGELVLKRQIASSRRRRPGSSVNTRPGRPAGTYHELDAGLRRHDDLGVDAAGNPHPNPLPAKAREEQESDPVTLELMGARFMAIAEEMGEALRA